MPTRVGMVRRVECAGRRGQWVAFVALIVGTLAERYVESNAVPDARSAASSPGMVFESDDRIKTMRVLPEHTAPLQQPLRTARAFVEINDDDIQKGANGTCVDDEDSVLPSRRDSARRLDDGRHTIRRKTSAARVACDAPRISRRRGAHTSSLCPLHGRLA